MEFAMSAKHLIKYKLLVLFNKFRHSHLYKNKTMFRLIIIKWFLLSALLICGLAIAPHMYLGFVIIFLVALYATLSLINTYTEHQLHRSNLRSDDGKGVRHDDLWGG
jgi:thiosulfate reductase cytochrome b subunit